jgi:hypothetical protein
VVSPFGVSGVSTPSFLDISGTQMVEGSSLPSVQLGSIFVVGLRDRPPAKPGAGGPTSHLNTVMTVSRVPCAILRIVEPCGDAP